MNIYTDLFEQWINVASDVIAGYALPYLWNSQMITDESSLVLEALLALSED